MTKIKIQPLILLFLIILIGFATRFYKLGQIPAGLYLDEAAQGYNAYSILKTGKDEFGQPFPIIFRSFADFKTPVYIYLITPLIPIFGLTPFTVRLPSFIFSLLTFPLIYLLIAKITPSKKPKTSLALLTTFLLAISPWHVLFGRTNFECNVALFFLLAGIYLFYLGLKRPLLLIVSAIMFAVSIPAYHSERIITPLTVLLLFVKYRSKLLETKLKSYTLIGVFIATVISLPTLSVVLTPGFFSRVSTLSIFSPHQNPAGFINNLSGPLVKIVNGSWFLSTKEFLSLYLSYFSPRNMFNLGDYGPRSSFPELATFYSWQFPFYLYGLYLLVKNKDLAKLRFLTLVLLLTSPLPAALTRDPYSTIRSLPLAIPQLIIISLGLVHFYLKIKTWGLKIIGLLAFFLIINYSILHLYSSAIILNEYFRADQWNYGWQQVVEKLQTLDPSLSVVVDNARSEPYSQLLFFLQFDPETYQQDNFEVPLSEYYTNLKRNTTKKIGQIVTRPINWVPDTQKEQYLVGDNLAISEKQIRQNRLQLINEIKYPNSNTAFRIVKTNPP